MSKETDMVSLVVFHFVQAVITPLTMNGGLPFGVARTRGRMNPSRLPEKRQRSTELWRHIAVLLLVLLVVENWLADRR